MLKAWLVSIERLGHIQTYETSQTLSSTQAIFSNLLKKTLAESFIKTMWILIFQKFREITQGWGITQVEKMSRLSLNQGDQLILITSQK